MACNLVVIASMRYQIGLWLSITACVGVWAILHHRAERRRKTRVGRRTALSVEEWWKLSEAADAYLGSLPREVVMGVVGALAELIEVSPTQLRWTDRITDMELPEQFVIDDAWNYYDDAVCEFAERYNGTRLSPDPNWSTVGDVIKGTVMQMLAPANSVRRVPAGRVTPSSDS